MHWLGGGGSIVAKISLYKFFSVVCLVVLIGFPFARITTTDLVVKYRRMKALSRRVGTLNCGHLSAYGQAVQERWEETLSELLVAELTDVSKTLPWPLTAELSSQPSTKGSPSSSLSSSNVLDRFQRCCINLTYVSTELLMTMLLRPFVRRFQYHFQGRRSTNNPKRPELYLKLILVWIGGHTEFLERVVQPLVHYALDDNDADGNGGLGKDAEEMEAFSCALQFGRRLVLLSIEKINSDLPTVFESDAVFAHFIDEMLHFHRELSALYSDEDASLLPNCLQTLCQRTYLEPWLRVEKGSAEQRIERMFSLEDRWTSLDESRIPHAFEQFVDLIRGITQRYRVLPQASAHAQFLRMQLELLDDFQIRIAQLEKEASAKLPQLKLSSDERDQLDCLGNQKPSSDYCSILNGLNYLVQVLSDWQEEPFFVHLYATMQKTVPDASVRPLKSITSSEVSAEDLLTFDSICNSLIYAVFDAHIELFTHMIDEMLDNCIRNMFVHIEAKSYLYRSCKWFSDSQHGSTDKRVLSAAACAFFAPCKDVLYFYNRLLSDSLYQRIWPQLCEKLDVFIFKSIVSVSQFSATGAEQFIFEIKHGLWPLFGACTNRQSAYFPRLKESCLLLALPLGSAILLKEELSTGQTDSRNVLKEFGIAKLTSDEVLLIIQSRNDVLMCP